MAAIEDRDGVQTLGVLLVPDLVVDESF
jgi:hypothetical protein